MKQLSPTLTAHLASGATTLCWCWRVARRDGVILGFTDHDRDLTIDGIAYLARSGLTASELNDAVGLSVDGLEVDGAITSDLVTDDDLAAGLYDAAAIEIWRVNWRDPAERVLMRSGTIGEVTRRGASFTAEIRGLADALQQPAGRLFQYTCDAELGDRRCGLDLARSDVSSTAVVAAVPSSRVLVIDGLDAFAADHFTRGRLRTAAGATLEIKRHRVTDARVEIELWQVPVPAIAPGAVVTLTAGCDKRFATCRDRFGNAPNFRGFPRMPGNDFVTAPARRPAS